jgi:L-ascorbate metabolism protein UlaG (beta-lactamase superfamily)
MLIEKMPEKNTVLFVWFNHYAGVLVKTPGKTLAIDPVDVKLRTLESVDAILVTHEHYDHLDQRLIAEVQKASNCMVVADAASAKRLQYSIPASKLIEARPGTEIKVNGVSIMPERCKHPAASPVTYILTSEDGVKLFHTADSLPFPEMAAIGEREKFDVVFCAVGIAPGASPASGAEIAKLTKPQVAIPYHTSSPAEQAKFAETLKKELPRTMCLVPERNKIYQIEKRK